MEIFRSIPELASLDAPLSLALGVFDGVHIGHRAVIGSALADAEASGGKAIVATFEPHPVRVLRPEAAPRLLASLQHKALLLERLKVDGLLVVPFDRVFANLTPSEFIGRLAEASRELRAISVGEGWQFGAGRSGNAQVLSELGSELGFSVDAVPPVELGGAPVSSTRIRAAIDAGDLGHASDLLGRAYTVLGTVVAGKQLGRTIGFPTANLRVQSEQLPPNGVYAVRAEFEGQIYGGVANLGIRPTIDGVGHQLLLEVHLFDFSREIYGTDMEVTFLEFLRPEQKFDGMEALVAQIEKDAEQARQIVTP